MKKHLLGMLIALMASTMSLNARVVLIDEGFENGIQEDVWTQEFVTGNTPWMVEDVSDGTRVNRRIIAHRGTSASPGAFR